MDNKPIRILQVNGGSKNFGGVSAMIFEIYKNIDKTKIQFDFVSPNKTTYELKRREIEEMGGKIFELNITGNVLKRKILLFKRLKKMINENEYKIIHINSGALFFNLEVAIIARIANVNKIIIHSHNSLNPNKKIKNFFINLFKPLVGLFGTNFFSCSELASKSMFSERLIKSGKVVLIKNGIDTRKFIFNKNIREKYRKELEITEKFVIGNVGRFVEQKNHKFLIEIFKKIININPNSVLLLIGEGEKKCDLENLVRQENLEKSVIFLGVRNDISNLMNAMDCFLFPTKYEGFGIVLLEAQSMGLPILVSNNVPNEVNLTSIIHFKDLNDSLENWAIDTLKLRNNNRENYFNIVKDKGYDINDTVRVLTEIYNQ